MGKVMIDGINNMIVEFSENIMSPNSKNFRGY